MTSMFKNLWPILLGVGGLMSLVLVGRRNGRLAERLRRAEERADLQRRIQHAAANTPTDRDSVIERLHDGRF